MVVIEKRAIGLDRDGAVLPPEELLRKYCKETPIVTSKPGGNGAEIKAPRKNEGPPNTVPGGRNNSAEENEI